ncbi:MAG: mycofactocin biosynthesis glycosyltransferase MftF, partial [Nitrososphaerales archaeon]
MGSRLLPGGAGRATGPNGRSLSQPARRIDGPAVVRPDALGVSVDTPLPRGTVVELAGDTRRVGDGILLGGSPRRLLRLSESGVGALEELERGPVASAAAGTLGRRLTDAGLAVVAPSLGSGGQLSVTVVVPVWDRDVLLARCLDSLGDAFPVVVVDDDSRDHDAVAAVCAAHGTSLVRRPTTGGPAAARNAGLAGVESELVAFCDSDCTVPPGWIEALAAHFDDPLVAAVAPRVMGDRPGSVLDLGSRSGQVAPLARISYVPAAALVVRRAALGDGFDSALRYGEDVDLVWRLVDAGWRVRYDATVAIRHAEPSAVDRVRRRFHYGTSAGPLATRHPAKVRHLLLSRTEAIVIGAVLAGYPSVGGAAFCTSAVRRVRRLGASGVPAPIAIALLAESTASAWTALGRCVQQFALPAVLAYLASRGPRGWRGRPGWRRVALALLAAAPLNEGFRAGAGGERAPVRGLRLAGQIAAMLAEQIAYGAGVHASRARRQSGREVNPV